MPPKKRKAEPDTRSGEQWDQNSSAAKTLLASVEDGTISLHSQPKTIWLSNVAFQQYNLTSFHNYLNCLRTKNGVRITDGECLKVVMYCDSNVL
jgi:hypothetical protein